MFRGCGEVTADRAELFGSGEGAEAAGDLLSEFDHADVAFGTVVVWRYSPVGGEAEVVVLAVEQPLGEGVVLGHGLAGAGGGVGDADLRGVVVELHLFGQGFRIEGT